MKKVLLGDIVDINPESITKDYPHSEIYYLDTASVTKNEFLELQKIKASKAPSRAKRIIRHGDIVYSTVRPNLKHYGIVKNPAENSIASTGFAVIRARQSVDFTYLYYWLTSSERTEYLTAIAESQTSTFPAFNPSVIEGMEINLPPIKTQKKIADILGSLDEKIELNRRMNETLEQIGQALFRHYFIDRVRAGSVKTVPLGKKRHPKRGKSLQSKNIIQGEVPVISGGLKPAGLHNESNTTAPVVTISASGANAGFVSVWGRPVWSADSSYIDSTITKYVYTYYSFLKNKQKEIYDMQTGSGQPHIYPKHIELLEIANLPDSEFDNFEQKVRLLFDLIHENKKQIEALSKIRDSLLPKLISGEIKV